MLSAKPHTPIKAKEITAQWASNLESTLKELETRHQLEMAKAMSYLKGIESMVDSVATTGLSLFTMPPQHC